MIRKKYATLLFIIIFMMSVIFYRYTFVKSAQNFKHTPINVLGIYAKNKIWHSMLILPGEVQSTETAAIKAPISGVIQKIFFQSGQHVNQNAPLLQLNTDLMRAEFLGDQATFKNAEASYKRTLLLYQARLISRAAFDAAEANFKYNAAHIKQDRVQLKEALIRAPFSGDLGFSSLSVGDVLQAGDPIVTLQNRQSLAVSFAVPLNQITRVHWNQPIKICLPHSNAHCWQAKVMAKENHLDAETLSLKIRAKIFSSGTSLLPGFWVSVYIPIENDKTYVTVPRTAIVWTNMGTYVYLVKAHEAMLKKVFIVKQNAHDVAIASGIVAGDSIVIAGQNKISEKSFVHLVGVDS